MAIQNLLPIGSVVCLKNGEKPLMIFGILPQNAVQRFDYLGVLYPEGYLSEDMVFMFNHEDIDEVKFIGYVDSAQQMFRNTLIKMEEEGRLPG